MTPVPLVTPVPLAGDFGAAAGDFGAAVADFGAAAGDAHTR